MAAFIIGYAVLMGIGCVVLYQKVFVPTLQFNEDCDILEELIRTSDDTEYQLEEFYRLAKFSWHRSTGARITTLGKMMELKYGLKLLK